MGTCTTYTRPKYETKHNRPPTTIISVGQGVHSTLFFVFLVSYSESIFSLSFWYFSLQIVRCPGLSILVLRHVLIAAGIAIIAWPNHLAVQGLSLCRSF